nr:hypothetical protein [Tanacetum cinerariifolium]
MVLGSIDSQLLDKIKATWTSDPVLQKVISELQVDAFSHSKYQWKDNELRRNKKLVIGDDVSLRQQLLQLMHNSPQGGHSGITATLKRIQRLFYWAKLKSDVLKYIRECEVCQKCKADLAASPGMLQPLPIPKAILEEIAMDFIKGLPLSKGKNVILVAIDRLSKYAHFIPLKHPFSALTVAQKFLDNIVKLHGFPISIVSDGDKIFLSQFWKGLLALNGIDQNLSTAYHPQSDGQSKVLNRCLEGYLRCMCFDKPSDWARWLPLAEYWYNTSFYIAIKCTPFEIVYGQKKPLHLPYLPGESKVEALDRRQVAYTLQLPPNSAIHPTFHVALLKPHHGPLPPSTTLPLTHQLATNSKFPDKVLEIRTSKRHNAAYVEWLIQWKDEPKEEATWESAASITTLFPDFDPWGQGSS